MTYRIWLALLVLVLAHPAVAALLPFGLRGYANVAAVQTEVGSERASTLRQDYSINATRELTRYLQARGALRYFQFENGLGQAESYWRQELRPSAGLSWRHPLFTSTVDAYRRDTRQESAGLNLINDGLQASLRTRSERYPLFSADLGWTKIHDQGDRSVKDVRDRNLRLGATWSPDPSSLNYTFTHRVAENQVSDLRSTQDDHQFRAETRLRGGGDDGLSAWGRYRYAHASITDEIGPSGLLLEAVPTATGLYARDSSPAFDELPALPELVDGDRSTPTEPPIDIGGASVDQNLGLDLGFSREVNELYLYTDRVSGSQPRWDVYVSEDNLNWQFHAGAAQTTYNASLLRYQIAFARVETRYVKVVNAGLNEIATVHVTELEAYLASAVPGRESKRQREIHAAELQLARPLGARGSASLTLGLREEPEQAGVSGRRDFNYLLRAQQELDAHWSQSLRWDQSWQNFADRDDGDLRNDGISWTLSHAPLPTLRTQGGITHRQFRRGDALSQELTAANARLAMTPFPNLDLQFEGSRSRNIQYDGDLRSETWLGRTGIQASPWPRLRLELDYRYQHSRVKPSQRLVVRRNYGAMLSLRLSDSIQGRSSAQITHDEDVTLIQDHVLTWRLSPRLSLSGQANLTDLSDDQDSRRYSGTLNLAFGRRTALYARIAISDLRGSGGERTTSFQQGIRTTF